MWYYALILCYCCLTGKLVDVTKNYKYMYICCGSVVIFASIWLFIGNFINYRLLERERKIEKYNKAETEEPDRDHDQIEENTQAFEELNKKVEDEIQRETNI